MLHGCCCNAAILQKFDIPAGLDYWILQTLGKRWRNWKSHLKAKHFNQDVPFDIEGNPVEERVLQEQWVNLVAYWNREEAQLLSRQNREIRRQKMMHHRTGKKSFAQIASKLKKELGRHPSRVRMFKECFTDKKGNLKDKMVEAAIAEMDDRTTQLQPGQLDEAGPSDVFAQVRGPERNGRVRMYGGGVTPSDLWGDMPSRSTSYRLAMEQKSAYENLAAMFKQQAEQIKEQGAIIAHMQEMITQQNGNGRQNNTSPTSSPCGPSTRPLRVDAYVALKSISDSSRIIAKGYLRSLNPNDVVGRYVLGKHWCEVLVQVAVDPSEVLLRPYDLLHEFRDAIGCPVAWPNRLVITEDD